MIRLLFSAVDWALTATPVFETGLSVAANDAPDSAPTRRSGEDRAGRYRAPVGREPRAQDTGRWLSILGLGGSVAATGVGEGDLISASLAGACGVAGDVLWPPADAAGVWQIT